MPLRSGIKNVDLAPTSPKSQASCATTTTPSPYRRRFHGGTRREAWEKLMKKSPREKGPPASPTIPPSNDGDSRVISIYELNEAGKIPSRDESDDAEVKLLLKQMEAVSFKVRTSVGSEDEKKSFASGNTSATTATSAGYDFLPDEADSPEKSTLSEDDESDNVNLAKRLPQHLEPHVEEQVTQTHFYRVVYRGVVALVSLPDSRSQKTGAYVSYGEIISSDYELEVEEIESVATVAPETRPNSTLSPNTSETSYMYPDSPPRSVLSQTAGSVSSLDTLKTASSAGAAKLVFLPKHHVAVTKRAIRVNKVLTGGYAVDAAASSMVEDEALRTPKRSNTHYLPLMSPSPVPLGTNLGTYPDFDLNSAAGGDLGFLFTEKKGVALVSELEEPPRMEHGRFIYQIVASTPIPILTGPCVDAPKTKAMLLPGTVNEVCLRLYSDDRHVVFLRLSHRRGWIADRKVSYLGGSIRIGAVPAVKEITLLTNGETDDSTISALSITSSSFSTAGSLARKRHRPPRRKQDLSSDAVEAHLMARHVQPKDPFIMQAKNHRLKTTPRKVLSPLPLSEKDLTPSSNVSVLSDDHFFSAAAVALDPPSPELLIGVSLNRTLKPVTPSCYLIRVNAPRGLRILDAPHFQVSNLIHGQMQSSKYPASSPHLRLDAGSTISTGSYSIFQTMGQGTHTTKSKTKIGNPAIFDPVKRARILPRGALFEASKRMENSGSFSEGAGLIKLSDDSGWAIVPTQDELDLQYRNYHGGVFGVREGEASRAFEEVGNAVIKAGQGDNVDHPSILWLRVTSRNGSTVECAPPIPELSNDGDSPTSSAGNSSISGPGSNYGILSGPDSDVASSVGSAFLDAMFKTPSKKKGGENLRVEKGRAVYKKVYTSNDSTTSKNNVIACGMCVEVEKWDDNPIISDKCVIVQDYVRLRGAQGWIARSVNGKTIAEVVSKPVFRYGSFWFRVLSPHGIKVRVGPSRRADPIKLEEGVDFRFECGEFLRACEVIDVFSDALPGESFAKLFRNRHIQVHREQVEICPLSQMIGLAEWVRIYGDGTLYLEECAVQPRIERHREGWRYNVRKESGVVVRRGPSFAAETVGIVLLPGKSVLVSERVMPPGERISWLRLKDGIGWVHDIGENNEVIMIAHSLRHRTGGSLSQPQANGVERNEQSEVAYNTIVARLFTQQEDWLRTNAYETTQASRNSTK